MSRTVAAVLIIIGALGLLWVVSPGARKWIAAGLIVSPIPPVP